LSGGFTIRIEPTKCGVCRVRAAEFWLKVELIAAAFPEARLPAEAEGLMPCCTECAPDWACDARRAVEEHDEHGLTDADYAELERELDRRTWAERTFDADQAERERKRREHDGRRNA